MKKTGIMLVMSLLLTVLQPSLTLAYEGPIQVVVDHQKITFPDAQPFKDKNDRIQVPVKFVSEALGAKVKWDKETQTVTVEMDGKVVELTVDQQEYKLNGDVKTMDTAAMLIDTRTFVPVRFISEGLGAIVKWEQGINTVYIYSLGTDSNQVEEIRKEDIYGFTVYHNTGSKLYISKGSYDEDKDSLLLALYISLLGSYAKTYDWQVEEAEQFLLQQVDPDTVKEIIKYVRNKTKREDELPLKKFYDNTYAVYVSSQENNRIGISIFYKE